MTNMFDSVVDTVTEFGNDTLETIQDIGKAGIGMFSGQDREEAPASPAPIQDLRPVKENTHTNGEIATIWGKLYQTESDPVKMQRFVQDQKKTLVPGLEGDIDTALSAFVGDKDIKDQSTLREILVATAKHESNGGRLLQQKNGPARGAFQVEPETALDLIKNSGLIGPKFQRLVNKTKKEMLSMTPVEFSSWLQNNKVSAGFAIAKYLQSADAAGDLGKLQ